MSLSPDVVSLRKGRQIGTVALVLATLSGEPDSRNPATSRLRPGLHGAGAFTTVPGEAMHGCFQGEVQQVTVADGQLELRCVREYFYPDGFVGDEVWVWVVEHPIPETVQSAHGLRERMVGDYVVTEEIRPQTLTLTLEDDETCTLIGSRIHKREEPMTESDLWAVVAAVSDRTAPPPEKDGMLHRRSRDVEAFLSARIDHLRHEAQASESQSSQRAGDLRWQVEDLESMLRSLRFGDR